MNHWSLLKQEKNYARLFAASIVNGMGDRFSQVAVLGLLLSLSGSGLAVGITFAIRLLPFLIFGPLGGMLADRFSKKRIMIATDLVRAAFALSPLLVRDAGDVWIIYVSSFLMAAGEALYSPARMSLIPNLVRKENLLHVNSLEEVLVGLVLIGGSVTGGAISSLLGVETTFLLNCLSFLVCALLLMRLPILHKAPHIPDSQPLLRAGAEPAIQSESHAGPNRAEETVLPSEYHIESTSPKGRPGFRRKRASARRRTNETCQTTTAAFRELLSGAPFLRLMLIIFAVWPIGDGIFNILLSVYAVNVFHMGDLGIGILYGALGAGLVVGSGLTGKFARHIKATAILALLAEGIFHVLISQSGSFGLLLLLLACMAVCSAIGNACNQTLLMTIVPGRMRGRFMGMLATLQNTIMGTAMFLGGFLLEVLSPRMLGLSGGLLLTVLGTGFAAVYFVSRRRYHRKDGGEKPDAASAASQTEATL
ncbi:MFS transporter [Fontibacillus sp. BL9]|uniref:MFS transporter n=1 Tax=Fontibacillus sp. BL9 TaxID=3389971 RepID=UPI00397820D5